VIGYQQRTTKIKKPRLPRASLMNLAVDVEIQTKGQVEVRLIDQLSANNKPKTDQKSETTPNFLTKTKRSFPSKLLTKTDQKFASKVTHQNGPVIYLRSYSTRPTRSSALKLLTRSSSLLLKLHNKTDQGLACKITHQNRRELHLSTSEPTHQDPPEVRL
jgi:hypothetical protein